MPTLFLFKKTGLHPSKDFFLYPQNPCVAKTLPPHPLGYKKPMVSQNPCKIRVGIRVGIRAEIRVGIRVEFRVGILVEIQPDVNTLCNILCRPCPDRKPLSLPLGIPSLPSSATPLPLGTPLLQLTS